MRLVSHPVLCNYYVTYRCNAACSFCDIWERPSPYITLEEAKANLAALKRLGVKVVDFTGGEPLLHRQLDELLKECKRLGLLTTITTNCLLYPKYANRLRGLVDMLHFSLDSPEREEHDLSRGVKCFDKVMESIQVAKSLGERPDILFTVFESNIHQIEKIWQEICKPHGLVLILNPVFEYNKVGSQLSPAALQQLRQWGKKSNVYLNDAFIQLRLDGGNHTDSPICLAGSTTIVISPENKLVLPCYHLGLKEFAIENNLYELYLSDEVQKLVALEGRLPACEGCAINCYMQPSFAVTINKYWWKALPSTLKYNRIKGTWKQLF
ncbi:MAG TPA: radical SAM protein [Runella sp.]|nr:radical SAM protein [Runella sp.]